MNDSNRFIKTGFSAYTEAGSNNISDGLFIRTAGAGILQAGNLSFEAGMLLNLVNRREKLLSAIALGGSRSFKTNHRFHFTTGGYAKWSFPGDLIRHSDLGIESDICFPRFSAGAGINFKSYRLSRDAVNEFDPDYGTRVSENWNLVYSLRYMIKRDGNTWNLGIGVSNTDYFIVSQLTSPALNLNGYYNVTRRLTIFGEARYLCTGVMNTNINHFGTVIRGGIKWNTGNI